MSINKDEFYNDQIKLIKYYEQCIKTNESRGLKTDIWTSYQEEINKINKFIKYADLVYDENKKQTLEIAFITKKNKELEIISNNYLDKNNEYIIKLEEFVNNLREKELIINIIKTKNTELFSKLKDKELIINTIKTENIELFSKFKEKELIISAKNIELINKQYYIKILLYTILVLIIHKFLYLF